MKRCFQFVNITRLFTDLEKKEREMDLMNYQHCNIGSRINLINDFGNDYPVLLHGSEESHYVEMKQIMELRDKGVRPVRGDDLKQLLEENKNDRPIDDEFNLCLSQETETIRRLDEEYKKQMVQEDLQQLQSTILPKLENNSVLCN